MIHHSIKQTVSDEYTKQQQTQHLLKKYPSRINAVITGCDNGSRSIGGNIYNTLELLDDCNAYKFDFDVTENWSSVDTSFYRQNALIMCHGATYMDWIEDMPDHEIRRVCDVNLYGTINCTKKFVQATLDNNERKKIISIGSMAYKHVLNGSAAYCASKAGVAHFMRCMAWELAPKGYDVYCIHPSNVDGTPMHKETVAGLARYRNMTMEQAEAYWGSNYIKGRSLSHMDIAALVVFLLTPQAEFLSGQQFELTGGQR